MTMSVPHQSAEGFAPPSSGVTGIWSSMASMSPNARQLICKRFRRESSDRAVTTCSRSPNRIADSRPMPFSPRYGEVLAPAFKAASTSFLREAVPITRKADSRSSRDMPDPRSDTVIVLKVDWASASLADKSLKLCTAARWLAKASRAAWLAVTRNASNISVLSACSWAAASLSEAPGADEDFVAAAMRSWALR